jgi:hypothetical protein
MIMMANRLIVLRIQHLLRDGSFIFVMHIY